MIKLEYLSIQNKTIYGDISNLRNCINLLNLRLYDSSVSGNIASLASCTSLQALVVNITNLENIQFGIWKGLGHCTITGDIANLFNLTNLEDFNGGYSDIYGDISVFKNLINFKQLMCHGTKLSGNLLSFKNHPSIEVIGLAEINTISGDISSLSTCYKTLNYFANSDNPNVSGDISSLRNCTSLKTLTVNKSRSTLTGTSEQTWNGLYSQHMSILDLFTMFMVILVHLKIVLN